MPMGMETLGILSALTALSAFVGNEYGKLHANSYWYDLLNFVSSLGLFTYALSVGAIPFVITNSVWATVSMLDLIKISKRLHTRRS